MYVTNRCYFAASVKKFTCQSGTYSVLLILKNSKQYLYCLPNSQNNSMHKTLLFPCFLSPWVWRAIEKPFLFRYIHSAGTIKDNSDIKKQWLCTGKWLYNKDLKTKEQNAANFHNSSVKVSALSGGCRFDLWLYHIKDIKKMPVSSPAWHLPITSGFSHSPMAMNSSCYELPRVIKYNL